MDQACRRGACGRQVRLDPTNCRRHMDLEEASAMETPGLGIGTMDPSREKRT